MRAVRPSAGLGALIALVGALAFAIVRVQRSGGGGYSDVFMVLGFLAFAFGVGGIYYAIRFVRGGSGAGTATSLSLASAAALVLFGLAAGLRH